MRLSKTEMGIQAMRARSVPLTPRQRGAFILCDSRFTKERVLANAKMAGVTDSDIQYLVEHGLVAEVPDEQELAAEKTAQQFRERLPFQRFREAYPMAVRLSSGLGLKGFRLNMAVEKCASYTELCGVAPAIKAAVDPKQFAPLEAALFG